MTSKIQPLKDRAQILNELIRHLDEEISQINKEIKEVRKVKGLSKDNIEFRAGQLEETILNLESLKEKASKLLTNSNKVGLLIFQQVLGKAPTNSDAYHLASDTEEWAGSKSISYHPEFRSKPAGSKWSAFHSRAEQNEFFHIFSRV